LKQSAERHYCHGEFLRLLRRVLSDKWCILGIACFAVEFVLWTLALQRLDVSLAYQLGCLSFVGVALLSRIWLGESISSKRWVGIILILIGSILVGAS
jgi:multidrug transporter EmrE-like cation transporter